MKNIHVLKTSKPSRLYFDVVTKELHLQKRLSLNATSFPIEKRNIYITNDEETLSNNGDYYLGYPNYNTIHKWNMEGMHENKQVWIKKIILTTDQDLIKDGVKAIDDEFLEWFVKNPSCEKVEFETDIIGSEGGLEFRPFFGYKIIIPRTTQQIIDEDYAGGLDMGQIPAKQEAKQDRTCNNNCSAICGECQIFEFRPMSGLEWLLGYVKELNKKGYKFIPSSNKEIVEHVKQMEKDNMINFLKSVFQQDNFDYEKAYDDFINKKRV